MSYLLTEPHVPLLATSARVKMPITPKQQNKLDLTQTYCMDLLLLLDIEDGLETETVAAFKILSYYERLDTVKRPLQRLLKDWTQLQGI